MDNLAHIVLFLPAIAELIFASVPGLCMLVLVALEAASLYLGRQTCYLSGLPNDAGFCAKIICLVVVKIDCFLSFSLKCVHDSFAGLHFGRIGGGQSVGVAGVVDDRLTSGKVIVKALKLGVLLSVT